MRVRRIGRGLIAPLLGVAAGGALAIAPLAMSGPAGALPVGHPKVVYVSNGAPCGSPTFSTITEGVDEVAAGGTVNVCPGTYYEDVVVTKPMNILGQDASVDPDGATNSPFYGEAGNNAFTVLAQHVTIEGFYTEGATGDGILTAYNHTTVEDTTDEDNGGTGIDLNGSSWSTVEYNVMEDNEGGGVYLTDDLGTPASHDLVQDNDTSDNLGGCGIILADHSGAGVFDNTIEGNLADDNGNDPAGSGAGIVLASPIPDGAVYDNIMVDNSMSGNGLAGITLHSHIPGQGSFQGNVASFNFFGVNNVGGESSVENGDDSDPYTTGIYVGSFDPLSISVTGNVFEGDQYGIFTAGPVFTSGVPFNSYDDVTTPYYNTPDYGG
jgi:parallel beta-helix repeat protein